VGEEARLHRARTLVRAGRNILTVRETGAMLRWAVWGAGTDEYRDRRCDFAASWDMGISAGSGPERLAGAIGAREAE